MFHFNTSWVCPKCTTLHNLSHSRSADEWYVPVHKADVKFMAATNHPGELPTRDSLEIVCAVCGYTGHMKTADADD